MRDLHVAGWKRLIAPALLTLSTASIAACSSSKSAADVDTAFIAKANTICADAVAQHNGAAFPVADFDPLHPKAADLPAIGAYFARYGKAAATAARLDALGPPTERQAAWTRLRAVVDHVAENAQRQIDAARKSDVAGFEQTVRIARSLSARIEQLAPVVGFSPSSPCRKVFG